MPTKEAEVRVDVETVKLTKRKNELARKYFEDESLWLKAKKGPLGSSLYAVGTFYKVLFNRFLFRTPLHSSWSLSQETAVRTMRWSLDAPLVVSRRSANFLEGFLKLFKCPEPLTKVRGPHGIRGYWIGPERWEGRYPEAIIMFIHGGGYVAASSLLAVQPLCHLLKNLRKEHKKHVRIFAVDYPLAPESQYQEIIGYVESAYRWLVGESAVHGSDNVMLCGDSAGGGMVLGLLQRIYQSRDEHGTDSSRPPLILPFGAMLWSPWVKPISNSASQHTNAKYDYLPVHLAPLAAEYYVYGREQDSKKEKQKASHKEKVEAENGRRVLDWLEQLQLANGDWTTNTVQPKPVKERMSATDKSPNNPFRDPLVSPIYTDRKTLASYPPLFVCYGGKEIFRDDIERFIQRFIRAKKSYGRTNSGISISSSVREPAVNGLHPDIEIEFGEHMVHDYLILYEFFSKQSRRTLQRMTSFISDKLDAKVNQINHPRHHHRKRIPSTSPELAQIPALTASPASPVPPVPPVPSPEPSPELSSPINESTPEPPKLVQSRLTSVSLPEWPKVKRFKARSVFSDTSHRRKSLQLILGTDDDGMPNSRRLPSNYFETIDGMVATNIPVLT